MKLRRATAIADGDGPSRTDWTERAALLALFVLLSAYLFLIVGIQSLASSSAWITGDWLINYSDGFIRRGLIGEISRQFHAAAGVDPVSVVVVCKALCYATMCASLLLLAARQRIGFIEIAILFSPALLPFEINDPLGSGRKEVLLLALFSSYVAADLLLSSTSNPSHQQWRFWFLLVSLPMLTLVHEGLFFFLPFFLVYGWVKHGDARGELRVFAIPYLLSAIAIGLSWIFRGGAGVSSVICSSITAMGVEPGVCGGATAALESYDVRIGASDIQRYAVLGCLTFGPLLWYASRTIGMFRIRQFVARMAIATIAMTPLFVVSEDWGRWMHVTGVLAFVTIFACKEMNVALPVRRPALAAAWLAALPVFVWSWQVPHWIHSPLPILRPSAAHLLVRAQEAYLLHAGTP